MYGLIPSVPMYSWDSISVAEKAFGRLTLNRFKNYLHITSCQVRWAILVEFTIGGMWAVRIQLEIMRSDNGRTSGAVVVVRNSTTGIPQEMSVQIQEGVDIKLLARVPDYIHGDIGYDVAVQRHCAVQHRIYVGRVFDVKGL
jgi:hypothetical protein